MTSERQGVKKINSTNLEQGNQFSFGVISGLFAPSIALNELLDGLPLGVLILDSQRRVIALNQTAESLTGFNREEAFGISCRYILRANTCLENCPAKQAESVLARVNREGNIINRDRRKIAVRIMSTPLKDHTGQIKGFLETVEDIRHLKADDRLKPVHGFGQLLGRSRKMGEVFRILPAIAQTDSSVLITGETGTGKDLVAEAVHEASNRSRGPFVKVNCGALPETLLESELFGHQKGAFTGAVGEKPGRIRMANQGTLFLTEMGDLPLPLQVKFLTFLDDKVVYPLGSSKGFQADVRVVAATHRNLERMVKEGFFREDLLFRLNVVRLNLPPLRDRGDDVFLLLDHFLKIFNVRFQKDIKGFSEESRRLLGEYVFPGNVRELRNIVEYAANICQQEFITLNQLPSYLIQETPMMEDVIQPTDETNRMHPGRPINIHADSNWLDVEKQLILDALVKAKGKRSKAAEILGWGRSTLWRKMKEHDL